MQTTLEPEVKTPKFLADPLVSMIVPIYDIKTDVLKRCLMSLVDQDYERMEIICVLDGENKELESVVRSFQGSENNGMVKLTTIEHAGACAARNAGFKLSNGEIVSFFNSDYIAKPGMIRMWVDKLKENPDCGFVYGGYEYASNRRWIYPSKPFDPFQLEVANYIDCGFPLWRKYVVEWDINCKSLQDWDFWIRVVKEHKVKGFYLGRDYSFIAEMPREKGLSDDSSHNWIDRVNYVKTKNQIEKRDILVTSIGAANHGVEIAKLIGGDFRDDTFYKPSEYKAVYMIGFYIRPGETGLNEHARQLAHFKDHYPKSKRIVHFVGADIHFLKSFPFTSLKYLAGALRQSADYILSENQAAHDELLEMGIPTQIVPIPSYTSDWEVKPLPEDFKVSIYLVEPGNEAGKSDFDKYCYEAMLSVVRAMPDVQFTGYGAGGSDVRYPNLKIMGNIPRNKWKEYVYDNSCLLRIVRHDTKPLASNEFMLAGRPVVSNIKDECTHYIDTSGKDDISSWDKFGEGLNSYHWPETKAHIIRAIRHIKKNPEVIKPSNLVMKDQQKYINKIKELCGL